MSVFTNGLQALIRRTKQDAAYTVDPAMTSRMALQISVNAGARFVRGLIWRRVLGSAGPNLMIAEGVRFLNPQCIKVGRSFKAEPYCEIQGLSRRGLVFGDGVTIGRNVSIRPSSYYGNLLGEGLVVGDGSSIGPFGWIGCSGFIKIGCDVMLGPRVSLLAENHVSDDINTTIKSQGVTRAGISIADDCWIGAGASILDGVSLGQGVIVAAGAVVTKSVEPHVVVGGVPARVLRRREH